MLGLPDYGFAAVARDSMQSIPEYSSTNRIGASFETRVGRLLVFSARYFLACIYFYLDIYVIFFFYGDDYVKGIKS